MSKKHYRTESRQGGEFRIDKSGLSFGEAVNDADSAIQAGYGIEARIVDETTDCVVPLPSTGKN